MRLHQEFHFFICQFVRLHCGIFAFQRLSYICYAIFNIMAVLFLGNVLYCARKEGSLRIVFCRVSSRKILRSNVKFLMVFIIWWHSLYPLQDLQFIRHPLIFEAHASVQRFRPFIFVPLLPFNFLQSQSAQTKKAVIY